MVIVYKSEVEMRSFSAYSLGKGTLPSGLMSDCRKLVMHTTLRKCSWKVDC